MPKASSVFAFVEVGALGSIDMDTVETIAEVGKYVFTIVGAGLAIIALL